MKFPKLAVLLLASWILQGFGWVQSTMAADPVLVVSIEGTDNLVSDVEYLMDATGTSAFGQFFLPTVKNYLQGINGESPIGVVVTLEGGQPKVLGFVPVTDLKRFLGNIEEQVGAAEDAGDGVLELQGPQSIFVKEHNGWAFLGQTVEALDDLPGNPEQLLGGLNTSYDIGVRVFVQNIPAELRDMAIQQLNAGLQQGLADIDDEDAAASAKASLAEMEKAINQLDQITLGLNIDQSVKRLFMDMSVTAKEGTELAKEMAYSADVSTKFSGFLIEDAAISGAFAGVVAEDKIDQTIEQMQTVKKSTLKELQNDDELDDAGRAAAEALVNGIFDVFIETIKTGKLDTAMSVVLEEKEMTMALAAHVADSAKVEKMVQDIVEMAKKESEISFTKLNFNAETKDGIRYHDLAVAVPDDEYVNKIFNGELEVCIGAAENAVYVSMGTTPKTHLQKMIGASKAAPAKKIMPLQFVVKMLPLLKFAQSMEDNPAVAAMIDGLESGNDHVRVNVMPISSGFTYRFELEEGVLELLGKAAVSGQQAAAAGF
ncbi:MAG: hypothetical protein KDA87_08610 [Planctomycetales bacterium]|nr:hypothetical protein [Planctomycetales bacterium]